MVELLKIFQCFLRAWKIRRSHRHDRIFIFPLIELYCFCSDFILTLFKLRTSFDLMEIFLAQLIHLAFEVFIYRLDFKISSFRILIIFAN